MHYSELGKIQKQLGLSAREMSTCLGYSCVDIFYQLRKGNNSDGSPNTSGQLPKQTEIILKLISEKYTESHPSESER